MILTAATLVDGLVFPECPRWHDGALWFADVHAHAIARVREDGSTERVVLDARQPAGLGWAPDGALLYVRMVERTLVRRGVDGERIVADLTASERVQINDMVVDARGRAYLGGFGFDINRGDPFEPASVYVVEPDGSARVAAADMQFPNGMVITPDGRTLIVAETVGRRLTAFDIAPDASLTNRRIWAELPTFPDGICLDAKGAVWVAAPVTGECLRVRAGGEITDKVTVPGKGVYACMLGGHDGRTLYLCVAKTSGPELARGMSTGWIEHVRVDVPHAGLP
ncbi:MAG TPA: SMP-30/gluconolactonase/LRE family protein [Dehalococcoidia bacterium]|nr:SMP-30/gluconolactonase/LRE family protein [Dehalococcoidia bacterium]